MFKTLYPRTIWLIFLSFAAIIFCLALFRYWLPQQEETKANVDQANLLYAEGNKLKQVVTKKNNAVQATIDAERAWLPYVADRTPLQDPVNGGVNLNVNAYQLLLDTKRFRNNVQRAVNKQLIYGGIKVISGPRVPGVTDQDNPNLLLSTYYNYPVIPFPVVIHDLGQVQVRGTYEQIMKNVRAWENMPRYLAVTHGLELQGTAPTLTATYNLTIVGYIRYDGIYPPVPDGAGAGANTGPAGPTPGQPGRPNSIPSGPGGPR